MNNVTSFPGQLRRAALPEADPQGITRIHLFGEMRVIGPAGNNVLPPSKKTKMVLAYLCLSRGERILRARLAGIIWDRSGEAQALDSLRHALHELNCAGATWKLERERHAVRLDTTGCWIDAFEAPERAELLLDSLHGVSTAFDQWLIGERVRFETHWQNALERELQELIGRNATPAERVMTARRLLSVIPTHEGAVRCLMAAFTEMDDRAEALREFERFRLLASPDGFPLSQQTIALYEAIRVGSRPKAAGALSQSPHGDNAVVIHGRTERQASPSAVAMATVSEPSIAVLPFDNLSDASGHEYVAQGITEDLIETLSRVPGLSVVSRLSAAMFKDRNRPAEEIAAALGVRYVISGSLRIIENHLRLIVELVEADAGRALWRSRFDHKTSDLLELQNGLAEGVMRAVAPRLRSAELQRIRIKRPEDLTAYDLFLRGQENMHSPARAAFERSKELFEAAIERQLHYAAAHAGSHTGTSCESDRAGRWTGILTHIRLNCRPSEQSNAILWRPWHTRSKVTLPPICIETSTWRSNPFRQRSVLTRTALAPGSGVRTPTAGPAMAPMPSRRSTAPWPCRPTIRSCTRIARARVWPTSRISNMTALSSSRCARSETTGPIPRHTSF